MRVITIQSKEVLMILKKYGKYTVPNNAPVSENLIKPHMFMMKHYGYKNRPIFLCPIGFNVNFGGANTDGTYIVELDIPDRFCKIQDYYGWSDFIYFTEVPGEYEPFKGYNTVEQFGKYVLDMYKNGFDKNPNIVYQITTQFLLSKWVVDIKEINDNFIDRYVDTGGINILKPLRFI